MKRLSDSKTGAKVTPLGPPALAILSELRPVEGSPLVFPAEAGAKFTFDSRFDHTIGHRLLYWVLKISEIIRLFLSKRYA